MRAVLLLALFALALASGPRDLNNYSYEQYRTEFNKSYELSDDLAGHAAIFQTKLAQVKAQNALYLAGKSTWFAAVNQFTDLSEDEVKRWKGLKKSSRNADLPRSPVSALRAEDLPVAIDWRDKKVVTPVKDQGGCGSCWAFSTAETVESHAAISTGTLQVLSPQQIVSCATNPQKCGGTGGCEGATQEIGFNYTRDAGGLSLDSEYPYFSGIGIDIPCNQSLVKPVQTVGGYYKLDTNNALQLQTVVATVGPVAISVAASGSFQMYGGGVLSDSGCGWDVDHAVQLVGYGVDSTSNMGFWLVRNSWNALWGEGGYIRIFRQTDGKTPEACGTDTTPGDGDGCPGGPSTIQVCGECAILSDSSYPFGAKAV